MQDIFIIGGGVNGCGIARDAAGRGLSVTLAEKGDLASATSSASTKLFHGGLRYLEYFEIKLVRHALAEREILLRAMPHISWPLRFVLPYHPEMRFEGETPVSRILSVLIPWLRGRRPAWLIRFGLFLYDTLGKRELLPGTKTLRLENTLEGEPLQPRFKKAFEYSDCWVEDSRLVVLNAVEAKDKGAKILTRTCVTSARRSGEGWEIETDGDNGKQIHHARILVNAAGPWVEEVVQNRLHVNSREGVRLVRGSHIVTHKLYDHDKCYFLQGKDGRIIFAIPYEGDFTLIGTTDAEHPDLETPPVCTPEERDYLLDFANQFFRSKLKETDIVWTYSGVRPLYDDGATSATAATRDYVLSLDDMGPPLLSIFGGKITTYRKLAEDAMDKLARHIPNTSHWTAGAPLPGGDFPVKDVPRLIAQLQTDFPKLDPKWAKRMFRAYGLDAWEILKSPDLGRDFGATLTEVEVRWLMNREFAKTAEDVVWRRGKLGLRMTETQINALDDWMKGHLA